LVRLGLLRLGGVGFHGGGLVRFALNQFFFLACLLSLSVAHVTEHLYPPEKLLGDEDPIHLVNRNIIRLHEHARPLTMFTEIDQQSSLIAEDLDPVLGSIDNPDVAVWIDGNPLGAFKMTRPIAVRAEGTDEVAVGIEDL